ncbi:hypothetical protein PIB30_045678 [Stylosanthes scabra]|uniref:Uncharacterized protein n=1 Tax=Stylosanthes scabra TaxID=79078 RepID=A0ABU6RGC6_9FABA|nr:hypothetical protein [Stylosanthes scabra]
MDLNINPDEQRQQHELDERIFYLTVDPYEENHEFPRVFYRKFMRTLRDRIMIIDDRKNEVELKLQRSLGSAHIVAGVDNLLLSTKFLKENFETSSTNKPNVQCRKRRRQDNEAESPLRTLPGQMAPPQEHLPIGVCVAPTKRSARRKSSQSSVGNPTSNHVLGSFLALHSQISKMNPQQIWLPSTPYAMDANTFYDFLPSKENEPPRIYTFFCFLSEDEIGAEDLALPPIFVRKAFPSQMGDLRVLTMDGCDYDM